MRSISEYFLSFTCFSFECSIFVSLSVEKTLLFNIFCLRFCKSSVDDINTVLLFCCFLALSLSVLLKLHTLACLLLGSVGAMSVFSPWHCVGFSEVFTFHVSFRNSLSLSKKVCWTRIPLNLQIRWKELTL